MSRASPSTFQVIQTPFRRDTASLWDDGQGFRTRLWVLVKQNGLRALWADPQAQRTMFLVFRWLGEVKDGSETHRKALSFGQRYESHPFDGHQHPNRTRTVLVGAVFRFLYSWKASATVPVFRSSVPHFSEL